MRRLLALILAVGTIASVAGSATAASTSATFQVFFGGKAQTAHPCAAEFFLCGGGALAGYGAATTTIAISGFTHPWDSRGCLGITFLETITLADGSGSVTLAEGGDLCAPSAAAADLPLAGLIHTYGAPYRAGLTYTVVAGTGVFAGSSGSGTASLVTAGESGFVQLVGTL
jgi:hypothetical protein